jgi:hypothetical protein
MCNKAEQRRDLLREYDTTRVLPVCCVLLYFRGGVDLLLLVCSVNNKGNGEICSLTAVV